MGKGLPFRQGSNMGVNMEQRGIDRHSQDALLIATFLTAGFENNTSFLPFDKSSQEGRMSET